MNRLLLGLTCARLSQHHQHYCPCPYSYPFWSPFHGQNSPEASLTDMNKLLLPISSMKPDTPSFLKTFLDGSTNQSAAGKGDMRILDMYLTVHLGHENKEQRSHELCTE